MYFVHSKGKKAELMSMFSMFSEFSLNSIEFNLIEAEFALFPVSDKPPSHLLRLGKRYAS